MQPLFFRSFGDPSHPPLVFLHGLLGSGDNFRSFANIFSSHYFVILPDLCNHGQSFHASHFSYDSMAQDLKELMGFLSTQKMTLVGHSMGGKVALSFLYHYPDLLHRLIVLDILPIFYDFSHHENSHSKIFKALLSLPLDQILSREEIAAYLSQFLTDSRLIAFLLKNIERSPQGFSFKSNVSGLWQGYTAIQSAVPLKKTDVPTLFLFGQHSEYYEETAFFDIHPFFKVLFSKFILNAGHWIFIDQPQACLNAIQDFLKE